MIRHNRFILAILTWSVLASSGRADVLLTDSFSYPDGPLVNHAGGRWLSHSGTAGQADTVDGALHLTEKETEDISATLSGAPYAKDSGVVLYAGFKATFGALPAGGGGFFAHFKDTGASNFRGRVFAATTGAAAGSFRLGIASAGSVPVLIASDLSLGTSYRVVMALDINTAVARLWLNPLAETDAHVVSTDNAGPLAISTFAFRQSLSSGSGMGVLAVDDLNVARTFGEALGPADAGLPVILDQPRSRTNVVGGAVIFNVTAAGTAPLAYQWRFQETDIPGATAAVLSLSNLTTLNSGTYRVLVSSGLKSILSAEAALTVNPAPPPVTSITAAAAAAPDGIRLTWNSVAGATYQVLRGAEARGPYTTLQSDVSGGTYTDAAGGERAFYLIRSP